MIKTKVKMIGAVGFDEVKASYGKARLRTEGLSRGPATAGLADWAEPGDRRTISPEERDAMKFKREIRRYHKIAHKVRPLSAPLGPPRLIAKN